MLKVFFFWVGFEKIFIKNLKFISILNCCFLFVTLVVVDFDMFFLFCYIFKKVYKSIVVELEDLRFSISLFLRFFKGFAGFFFLGYVVK